MANDEHAVERRAYLPFEVRQDDEAQTARVVGHAAVFNQEADIAGLFREVIRPGAFTRAINESDVPFLAEHGGLPLARNRSGTLKLSEDSVGLRIESELDLANPRVREVMSGIRRGDLDRMSFAFKALRQEIVEPESEDDLPLRILNEVELFDVSVVTSPAYEGTDIGARSVQAVLDERRAAQGEEEKRKAFELRKVRERLARIPDLRQRESALASARRRIGF